MSDPTASPKHEQFMALFVRHEPGIHSFLTSLLASLDDAEVVMQETSMTMWKKFEQFEPGMSFRNWAFQIAQYEAMNFRRKRRRDRHVFSDELVQLLADDAARNAAQLEEERRVLAHCVAKLSSRDRGVLSGCYREATTIKAYATSVGRTPNAVRKHLAKIRTALSTRGLSGDAFRLGWPGLDSATAKRRPAVSVVPRSSPGHPIDWNHTKTTD